jgi:hypothetical protein
MSRLVKSSQANIKALDNLVSNLGMSLDLLAFDSLQPTGMLSGTSLWIESHCPTSTDDLLLLAQRFYPKGDRRNKCVFMALSVLLVSRRSRVPDKVLTPGQVTLVDRFADVMPDYVACMLSTRERTEVLVSKELPETTANVPIALATDSLRAWCKLKFPQHTAHVDRDTDIQKHGQGPPRAQTIPTVTHSVSVPAASNKRNAQQAGFEDRQRNTSSSSSSSSANAFLTEDQNIEVRMETDTAQGDNNYNDAPRSNE